MLNPLSWKLNTQESTQWDGFLIETKILIRKAEEFWVTGWNRKMENQISGFLKEQIEITLIAQEFDGEPKEIDDRSWNQRDDYQIPKLKK